MNYAAANAVQWQRNRFEIFHHQFFRMSSYYNFFFSILHHILRFHSFSHILRMCWERIENDLSLYFWTSACRQILDATVDSQPKAHFAILDYSRDNSASVWWNARNSVTNAMTNTTLILSSAAKRVQIDRYATEKIFLQLNEQC